MGMTSYEITIPIGMIFRKMFCHKCGTQLKKEKISKIYKKGESGFHKLNMLSGTTFGISQLKETNYIYKCPKCGAKITYDNQCIIAKKQKRLKKKILNEDDLDILT